MCVFACGIDASSAAVGTVLYCPSAARQVYKPALTGSRMLETCTRSSPMICGVDNGEYDTGGDVGTQKKFPRLCFYVRFRALSFHNWNVDQGNQAF